MTEVVAIVMLSKLELRTRATLCALARGALLSSAVFGGLAAAQFTPPSAPPVIPPSAPPVRLWHHGGSTTKYGAEFYRDLYVRTLDKVVSFEWRWVVQQVPSFNNERAHTSEEFATEYWPTIALQADRDHLFVGGKAVDGVTILERWTFDSSAASGSAIPSVDLSCGALGTETPHYEWKLPRRTRVEEVLHLAPDSPQGMIRDLLLNLKSTEKLFVYYDGSRELYSLDVPTQTQTLQASPTGTSSSLRVPELRSDYRRCWSVDYTQKGHCYFFGPNPEAAESLPIPGLLVLIDSDRDGRIDSSMLISAEEWSSYWGNMDNFAKRKD